MFSRLHPNTKIALSLVAGTLASVAAVVLLMNLHTALVAQPERIFFANFDGNDFEIYVMNEDGSDVVQLTDNGADDWGPSLSPNGRQVAFRSDRDGVARVYVMNIDGTGVEAVSPAGISTGTPYFTTAPAWSPNGYYIAYEALVNNAWNIYMTAVYGGCHDSYMMQVTHGSSLDAGPAFSPDGTQIAFHSYRNGEPDIYVVDINGMNERRLTFHTETMDVFPIFSPDGENIVFHSERDGDSEIFIMDADGSDQRNLTENDALDRVPRYSDDGNRIIFRSERGGDSDIYVMDMVTGREEPLVDSDTLDMHPDW